MADQKPETVNVPVPANMSAEQFMQFMSTFAEKITGGIAAGINEARPQKVTPGRYDPKTPFQPCEFASWCRSCCSFSSSA